MRRVRRQYRRVGIPTFGAEGLQWDYNLVGIVVEETEHLIDFHAHKARLRVAKSIVGFMQHVSALLRHERSPSPEIARMDLRYLEGRTEELDLRDPYMVARVEAAKDKCWSVINDE